PPASLTPIQVEEVNRFSDDIYVTNHLLGDGASGRVFLSVDTRGGVSKQISCKVMDIDAFNKPGAYDKYLQRWQQEIDVIRQLRHPNIIGFVHAVSSPHNLYLFTELASGGDLFSFVQLVNGVAHLHAQGVVHRDLKPENVLFAVRSSPLHRVVISDFGNCGFLSRRLKSMVGTEQEMHKRGESHDHLVDIWGLGTIMLFMINGHELTAVNGFPKMTQDQVYANIHKVCMESKARPGQAAQDFVRRCCQVASRDRMTTPVAQTHSWFDDPRHLKLLDVAIRSCRKSWKPATGIYPPTDMLPDLSHLVTPGEEHETRTSEVISSAASGLTASQYFTNIDMEVPANLPTPPGIPIRLLQHEDLAVQDPNIEVPCSSFNEEYTSGEENQSQGFRPAGHVHESQDIIPDSLPESVPVEMQMGMGMRHHSMFI
ncbi:kinase-like domain-containing protein, partial [Plectosphaerella plurivora]